MSSSNSAASVTEADIQRTAPADGDVEAANSNNEAPLGIVAAQKLVRGKNEIYQGLILLAEGYIQSPAAAERFRILRAKLERLNLKEKRFRAISVTSAVPGEGKSVVSTNLARALSIDPTGKTLLIDCDLRKPTIHKFFKLSREGGLTDCLFSKEVSNSFIHSVAPGLDVMTAGTAVVDPAHMLEQPEMANFLEQFKKYYRYVVIDCPPALLCPEPITVSLLADTTLLVVRAWKTDKRLVREAALALGADRIMGIVMNEGMDPVGSYLDYGYHGYYAGGATTRKFG